MPCHDHVKLEEYNPLHVEFNKNQHAMCRAGTLGASNNRTRREQESQEDREARFDRQRLRTNYLAPRQRWVPQLVKYNIIELSQSKTRMY